MAALRAQVDLGGQREVLADQLPHLQMPALIVWESKIGYSPYPRPER